ncbi:hypothetical protein NQF86_00355 [Bombella sp. TMW 2.2543]|uniref:Uncharacterized protein n=1 Tax=Bombella pluederhausensis TaxID=2967336 RepID=A0ABT3WDG1_9PROT|nr:hypothetical protein [Bombella pluederhausensis]MCX5617124.1 hypothetical protein [Bombella pluederhausensis]
MNLFSLASSMTSVINPLTPALLRRMTGTELAADYSTRPLYEDVPVMIDVQPAPGNILQLIGDIAQQGESRTIYLKGSAHTLSRPLQTGGDSVLFEGSEWLVTKILEQWGTNTWCRLIVTRQTQQTAN